ncbi:MAG: hypothetical protein JRH06_05235 [Deltaproteobacteria bacterium]|nr:hypothetical protein [Deltaproteobacteria bacterium]MBW2136940.1 hypothetical protein [Deltaproteobacteria bacterium]
MRKVVSIRDRLEGKKQKEQIQKFRGKIDTIQKIIQCSSCQMKCAMCGVHIREIASESHPIESPLGLAFCESCKGEFEDFIALSRGKKDADIFWHNKEWGKMWSSWLNYRKALNAFVESPEFRLLLDELDCHI